MAWTKLEENRSVMLEAQWVFRCCDKPAVSLKRGELPGAWTASLLCLSGISAVTLLLSEDTLEKAQAECEAALRSMGWAWGVAPSAPTASA